MPSLKPAEVNEVKAYIKEVAGNPHSIDYAYFPKSEYLGETHMFMFLIRAERRLGQFQPKMRARMKKDGFDFVGAEPEAQYSARGGSMYTMTLNPKKWKKRKK
ncbi:MAG: hypothetical protein MPK62_02205 [Alphaproteobacteria bacterium]|nr:hypothetical protein [Alphaproteobacteria bacterium]MDA8029947.1 hypothetical protein [Alphaproteobacteria bacterium]